jgi:hypothetical protein
MKAEQKSWTYFGVMVLPADRNGCGIRWTARIGVGYRLKADSKELMRQLIRSELSVRCSH